VAPQLGRAIVKGKCLCAEVDPTRASADFLALLLSSPLGTELIAGEARGSTRSMINVDLIKHLRVPMPDRYQQEAVAREFLDRRSKVDAVVATLQQQVQLLQERRQALITAAVTGQMHIPSAA
jgi:type I restriction enzyme, S subunit